MHDEYIGPYDHDVCHFKFKGCTKEPAAYGRREGDGSHGEFFPACENCARAEYDRPKNLGGQDVRPTNHV